MRRERGEGFYVYIYVALLVVVNMYVVTIAWTCLKTNTYICICLSGVEDICARVQR